jgi:hypothetical protein
MMSFSVVQLTLRLGSLWQSTVSMGSMCQSQRMASSGRLLQSSRRSPARRRSSALVRHPMQMLVQQLPQLQQRPPLRSQSGSRCTAQSETSICKQLQGLVRAAQLSSEKVQHSAVLTGCESAARNCTCCWCLMISTSKLATRG